MVISGVTTLIAIAAVLGVIGYRVFKARGKRGGAGGRHRAAAQGRAHRRRPPCREDRIAVTVDAGGAIEIRTFDLKTLQAHGPAAVRDRAVTVGRELAARSASRSRTQRCSGAPCGRL